MTSLPRLILPAIALLAFSTTSVRAETFDEVKKQIHEKVSKYKSLSYKIDVQSEMDTPQFKMKSSTQQAAQFVNKGDTVLARMETNSSSAQKMGEEEMKYDSKSLDVCDGKEWYTLVDQMGQKSATKRKADMKKDGNPFDPMGGFKLMEENFEIKVLPDETVNGKPAWVFEMKLKPGNPAAAMMGKTLAYYDKETGISIKGVSFDPAGKPTTTSTTSDVKINEDIPADKFVFKAPEGVKVQEVPDTIPPSMP